MPRFSERWPSFTDYIIEITREIWDQRKVLALHDYYAKDIVVRTPAGVSVGVEAVIAATYESIGRAPHRTAGAEDVIWSCDASGHFYSSHRNVDFLVHDQDDLYGPATGRKVWYWIVADCAARDDVVDDEWLVRDTGGVARQLGWHPLEFARRQITDEGGPEACRKPLTAVTDRPGPYKGAGNDDPWGAKYAAVLERVMRGDLSAVLEAYDEQCHCLYAGSREGHCPNDVNAFWATLRSSFPRARFTIQHIIGRVDDLMPPRAAIRWTLEGKHEGWGAFGRPTGAEVYIMGMSHAEFGPRGVRREYALFDEVAVWKQILLQAPALREAPDRDGHVPAGVARLGAGA
jgi:hypothetical protein